MMRYKPRGLGGKLVLHHFTGAGGSFIYGAKQILWAGNRVPEPATHCLAMAGVVLALRRRRR